MPHIKKATDQELLLSYRETGSVWATGKKFGMCGQSVHDRLSKFGVIKSNAGRKRTPELCARISAAGRGRKLSPNACLNIAAAKRGEKNPNWKGGRFVVRAGGYVHLLRPSHPNASKMGYVMEHRLAMEAHLGRILLPTEVVHHVNGNTQDNRIENLMLFSSVGKHFQHHWDERRKT